MVARLDWPTAKIWELPLNGDRTPRPLLQGDVVWSSAAVSPNGNWLSGERYQARPRRCQVNRIGAKVRPRKEGFVPLGAGLEAIAPPLAVGFGSVVSVRM